CARGPTIWLPNLDFW
nr:immunoglobulin heavy chain junction region [Macaca mulatta]MOY21517.1 immunoglobulin heavy chain junction region [Macaca mulatta]MOY21535.1 immunoglobulin heavy chain junction region [Macaca mulatta]MOY21790.1 immunoglobulin heavy chain junction region [Macaca mulatta]MOY21872.1 immunoglobulin heavy chain junction region [Macaca mulatta]